MGHHHEHGLERTYTPGERRNRASFLVALRTFLMGAQETGPVFTGYLYQADQYQVGGLPIGSGYKLASASVETTANDVEHGTADLLAAKIQHRIRVLKASAAGLFLSSLPPMLGYLITKRPMGAAVASLVTSSTLGVIATVSENGKTDEQGKWKSSFNLRERASQLRLVENMGIQLSTGLTALGVAQYGASITSRVQARGASGQVTQLSPSDFAPGSLSVNLGLASASVGIALAARNANKQSALIESATKDDKRREFVGGLNEGIGMAMAHMSYADGLGLTGIVRDVVAGSKSVVNAFVHVTTVATSNVRGKRLATSGAAATGILIGNALPFTAVAVARSTLVGNLLVFPLVATVAIYNARKMMENDLEEVAEELTLTSDVKKKVEEGSDLDAREIDFLRELSDEVQDTLFNKKRVGNPLNPEEASLLEGLQRHRHSGDHAHPHDFAQQVLHHRHTLLQKRQEELTNPDFRRRYTRKEVRLQLLIKAGNTTFAYVAGIALMGLASTAGGAAALTAAGVGVIAIGGTVTWRILRKRHVTRLRTAAAANIGGPEWTKLHGRVAKLKKKADRQRAKLKLNQGWREQSANLQLLTAPTGTTTAATLLGHDPNPHPGQADYRRVAIPFNNMGRTASRNSLRWSFRCAYLKHIENREEKARHALGTEHWARAEPILKELRTFHTPEADLQEPPVQPVALAVPMANSSGPSR